MSDFCIIIDSREQTPFTFDWVDPVPATKVQGLSTGDYSLDGFEDKVCIERKSITDLFGSVGRGRKRFRKEYERMQDFYFAAVIIESDWKDIYRNPPSRSKMDPRSILRTLIAWGMRYGVQTWACPGRTFAERLTYIMLDRFYRDARDHKFSQ